MLCLRQPVNLTSFGETWHAIPNRAAQMIFNRDAANSGEMLVDQQIAAVRGKKSESDWRGIVDKLQRRLLLEWKDV